MLNRHTIVAALAAVLLSATITNDALAAPFQPGDFIAYSRDSWGGTPSSGNAAQLLLNEFFSVCGGGAIGVGVFGVAGFSIDFTDTNAIHNYLPAGGAPAALNSAGPGRRSLFGSIV